MIHPPFTAAIWENLPRGTKLLRRDGKYETFLMWVPEATATQRLVTLGPEGDVYRKPESGRTTDGVEFSVDIIGIIQPVTLPEFWVVRSAEGAMTVHPLDPAEWRSADYWDREYPDDAPHHVEHHPARAAA